MTYTSALIVGAGSGLSASLARAFAKDNIRVNAIAPGFVDTQFVDWAPGIKEKQVAVSPMGRIPTVEDAANAVMYLACDATGITAKAPCYFECRFIGPNAIGTWPAFWLLSDYMTAHVQGKKVPCDE